MRVLRRAIYCVQTFLRSGRNRIRDFECTRACPPIHDCCNCQNGIGLRGVEGPALSCDALPLAPVCGPRRPPGGDALPTATLHDPHCHVEQTTYSVLSTQSTPKTGVPVGNRVGSKALFSWAICSVRKTGDPPCSLSGPLARASPRGAGPERAPRGTPRPR